MVDFRLKDGGNWKAYLIIGIIIIAIIAVYFTMFFYYSCDNIGCFQSHQRECAKTIFVIDKEEAAWKYTIEGESNDKCVINAEILVVKKGTADNQVLEGKSMICSLPLGSIETPGLDLTLCHGELKEEMQNLIIQKLHAYIVESVGQIGEELEQIPLI